MDIVLNAVALEFVTMLDNEYTARVYARDAGEDGSEAKLVLVKRIYELQHRDDGICGSNTCGRESTCCDMCFSCWAILFSVLGVCMITIIFLLSWIICAPLMLGMVIYGPVCKPVGTM